MSPTQIRAALIQSTRGLSEVCTRGFQHQNSTHHNVQISPSSNGILYQRKKSVSGSASLQRPAWMQTWLLAVFPSMAEMSSARLLTIFRRKFSSTSLVASESYAGILFKLNIKLGFGSLLFVASLICFVAWYVNSPLFILYVTLNQIVGNLLEILTPPLQIWLWLSYSSSSLQSKPFSMHGRASFYLYLYTRASSMDILRLIDYSSSRVMASIAGMLPTDVLVIRDNQTFKYAQDPLKSEFLFTFHPQAFSCRACGRGHCQDHHGM